MKKSKIISISVLSGLVLLSTFSFARSGSVNAPNGLILREEGSFSGKVITTIKDNAKVEILEESGDWYKVKYNDEEGYLYSKYVNAEKADVTEVKEDTNNKKQPETPKQNVSTDIKIYLIPSVSSQVIANANKDAKITVNYELGNWVNVSYDNKEGWARKYAINGGNPVVPEENINTEEKNKPEEPTSNEPQDDIDDTQASQEEKKTGYVNVNSSAIIREEASTSSDVVGTLLRNAEVEILGEKGDFYQIKYKDTTGYMSKKLISLTPLQ